MTKRLSSASALLGALLIPSLAFANTYIVDASGGAGSNFLDIPPAIAFAAPGDVLLVRSGYYSGFTLDKPLAIIGEGSVFVGGSTHVQATGLATIASLVNLDLRNASLVQIQDCAGTVIGDSLNLPYNLSVSGSRDVRLRLIRAAYAGVPAMLHVDTSRVELVESTLLGSDGSSMVCTGIPPGDGSPAVDATSGVIHVARCDLTGGSGGYYHCPDPGLCEDGGYGGDGLRLGHTAVGLVSGIAAQVLGGGQGGDCNCGWSDGLPGHGLRLLSGAQARYSGETISSILNGGGTLQSATPADPTMHILEVPTPGGDLTFRVNAPVGSHVVLSLGRRPIVVPVSGLEEDVLVQTLRTYDLGDVPAQGSVSLLFHVPITWNPGATRFFQAFVTVPGVGLRRTHSIPIVVR